VRFNFSWWQISFRDITDVSDRLIRPQATGTVSSSVTAGALRRGSGSGGRVRARPGLWLRHTWKRGSHLQSLGACTAPRKDSAALLPRGNLSPAGRGPETLLLMARGVSHPRARVCVTLGTTAG